ncbi:uncharacterized protein LOC135394776 isoform X3 [Ornithodoros turicata]|uniref:uncharacterized protein LOC135394776 isoform X3 n=1 Tax=Ornithodoros turicata TaxID=34597 RepID=UPI0031398BCD
MASESAQLAADQTQQTQMTVIPQEASTNVDSDGQVVARELARDVRVTEVGPSVRIQRHEARDCNCDCDCPSCLSEPVGWCILLTAFIISVPALAIIIIALVSVFSPQEIVNTSNPRSPHYCNNIVYTSAKYSACITAPFSFLICCRCCYSCCCSG